MAFLTLIPFHATVINHPHLLCNGFWSFSILKNCLIHLVAIFTRRDQIPQAGPNSNVNAQGQAATSAAEGSTVDHQEQPATGFRERSVDPGPGAESESQNVSHPNQGSNAHASSRRTVENFSHGPNPNSRTSMCKCFSVLFYLFYDFVFVCFYLLYHLLTLTPPLATSLNLYVD